MRAPGAKLFSWRRWAVVLPALLALAGCSDRAADLQIRLSHLQDELDHTKAELEAANRQAGSSSGSSVPLPSAAEIERNYDQAVSEMRHDLERQLTGGRVNNVVSYQPQIEEKPYHAEFSLEATLGSRIVKIEHIPVQAGLDGKWTFPSAEEVIGRLKQIPENTAPPPRSTQAKPGHNSPPQEDLVAPGPASETVSISWGDAPGAGSRSSPPPRSPSEPAPAPSAPAEPAKVMPTSRDVHIKF